MPRSASTATENNFVNGWVTEATGLNFPENAVTDSENVVFDNIGSVNRRLGLDLETDYTITNIVPDENSIFSEYLWESVAGDGLKTFFIQQVGENLLFYLVGNSESLSDNYQFTVNLGGYSLVALSDFRKKPFQYAAGFGRLFVTHPNMEPVYLQYSAVTNTVSINTISIQTRDMVGIPGPPVDRQSSMTDAHHYDLRNQGWGESQIVGMFQRASLYPSDYDVWWLYKTPDAFGTEVFLTDVAYNAGILNQIDRGNSPAPKGSVILNEFYQDRSGVTGIPNIPVTTAGTNRPSSVAFFAGRVFYGGVSAQNFNTKIYFTQILEGVEQAGWCYQQNDPTSQYASDLLPSDGGVISIPEVGNIIRIWPMEGSLIIFASNGIWQITGSQGIGFAANDYTVKKLSKQEVLSALSFVNVLGNPVWWSTDGIYTLASDQVGSISVKSLSIKKIESYYQDLSSEVKTYAKGAFNLKDKIIQWVYREDQGTSISVNQTYTKILNYDLQTEAFYKYSIGSNVTSIKGVLSVQGFGSSGVTETVIDNASASVTTIGSDLVTVVATTSAPVTAIFKYPVLFGVSRNQLVFSEEKNVNFLDWISVPEAGGGYDAEAFFTSGYKLRGEAQRKWQNNYLVLYTDNETAGAFFIQGRWDYATSGNTGRWSSKQKIDMPGGDYAYNHKRVKIRGHGLALQYQVESVPGRQIGIIGWSAWDTTNGSL